jgi:hypothetical protein
MWAIERFVGGIDELKIVLGQGAAPAVDRAKNHLIEALAARDRGDRGQVMVSFAAAMADLANLGDSLGPAEGSMMKAVTAQFIEGMAADDRDSVERNLAVIQSQAGTPKKPGLG